MCTSGGRPTQTFLPDDLGLYVNDPRSCMSSTLYTLPLLSSVASSSGVRVVRDSACTLPCSSSCNSCRDRFKGLDPAYDKSP